MSPHASPSRHACEVYFLHILEWQSLSLSSILSYMRGVTSAYSGVAVQRPAFASTWYPLVHHVAQRGAISGHPGVAACCPGAMIHA